MSLLNRSIAAPGLSALCAATLVAAPTVTTLPTARVVPVNLTSTAVADVSDLSTFLDAGSAGAVSDVAQSIDEALRSVVDTVEDWTHYGVSLVQWAIGLISYVPNSQIGIVYDLVASLVQNPLLQLIDGITGETPIDHALSNAASGIVHSFENFGSGEIGFLQGLLPPMPPLFGSGGGPTDKPGDDGNTGSDSGNGNGDSGNDNGENGSGTGENGSGTGTGEDGSGTGDGDTGTEDPGTDVGANPAAAIDLHSELDGLGGLDLSGSDFVSELVSGDLWSDLGSGLLNVL